MRLPRARLRTITRNCENPTVYPSRKWATRARISGFLEVSQKPLSDRTVWFQAGNAGTILNRSGVEKWMNRRANCCLLRTRHWDFITKIKHPTMAGRVRDVELALATPDEVRRSRTDDGVLLFYKAERERRWVCAVCRRLDRNGFLITAYPTDAIKEGERIWPE